MGRRPLLLINHRSPNGNSGKPSGISNYMIFLTRALLELGDLDVGMVTSWKEEDIPQDIMTKLSFYQHVELQRPRLFDVVKQALLMPKIVKQFGVDYIINIDPIGTPFGGKARFTIVHDLYSKVLPRDYPLRERIFSHLIMQIMIWGSSKLVCVSDVTKKDLIKYYPVSRDKAVRIYPNSSEVVSHDPIVMGEKNIEPYVLWVGTVTPNKNVLCFYEALELLAKKGRSIRSVVLGRDPFGLADEAEQKVKFANKPERKQNVSDEELSHLFANATCFVNTSLYEGFGMPVIEAQRAGVASICSEGGASAEVGGVGALTFDPRSSQSLANAIEKVFFDENFRSDLVERGAMNAERFSWAETAKQISALMKF